MSLRVRVRNPAFLRWGCCMGPGKGSWLLKLPNVPVPSFGICTGKLSLVNLQLKSAPSPVCWMLGFNWRFWQ